jgi:surfeit locus 1 family protein
MRLLRLTLGRWQFAPGLWPTLAAVAFFALTLSLGNWQVHRAEYKRGLQARVDQGLDAQPLPLGVQWMPRKALLYRRIVVVGVFDPAHEILLDNRIVDRVAGYDVLTPLRIDGGKRYVLVNRGWLPVGTSRATLPRVPQLRGRVRITGMALDPDSHYFEFAGAAPQGKLWQNLNFARYEKHSGLALQPVLLQQDNDSGDGLIRDWPRPDTGVAMHEGYAMQWYGLAATLVVLWLVLNLKRNEK